MLGLSFAAMYITVNVATIGYFLGEGRATFNPIKHVVVPVLGIVAMVIGFVSALGGVTIPVINAEVPPLSRAVLLRAADRGIWVIAGVVLYFFLRMRNPQATSEIGAAVAEA